MSPITIAVLMIVILIVCVMSGVHIAFALSTLSVIGIILISGSFSTGISILGTTAFESLRSYMFAVVPLFMMMGSFMGNSNAAKDLFKFLALAMRKLPGSLGVSTIVANAIFAAVTGVALASAAIFTRVAIPEMRRYQYATPFSCALVAAGSTLGMLIPPSMMFIMYGMLSEVSVGKLFIAGIIPGILLAIMFSVQIVVTAVRRPKSVYAEGTDYKIARANLEAQMDDESLSKLFVKVLPMFGLIALVLGGIWGGLFTPTEAAAIGAAGSLVIGIFTGMSKAKFKKALLETASGSASILFLLMCATMYSRMLTMSGVLAKLNSTIAAMDASPYAILALFMVVVLGMGCVLDATSILLIVTPLTVPLMSLFGFDLVWYGIIITLFIHIGTLTPPFGMGVFAVKAALGNDPVTIDKIFRASVPFILVMLIHAVICIIFPELSTFLPNMR